MVVQVTRARQVSQSTGSPAKGSAALHWGRLTPDQRPQEEDGPPRLPDCLCPLLSASPHPSQRGAKPPHTGRGTSAGLWWQLYNFSIILIQCECLIYLCDFILHLLFRIIDLYLSLLAFSNLPHFRPFYFFPVPPLSSPSALENLPGIPTTLSVSCSLRFSRKPCRAREVRLMGCPRLCELSCWARWLLQERRCLELTSLMLSWWGKQVRDPDAVSWSIYVFF